MRLGGYVEFKIKGLNVEKSFNKLYKQTDIYDLKRKSKSDVTFKVKIKDAKKVRRFLTENNFEIEYEKRVGFFGRISKLMFRYGILACLVLIVAAQFVLNLFVFRCEIRGNDKISTQEILEKVDYFKMKKDIDVKEIENYLLAEFTDLSFCSVIIKGQTLVINVKEKLAPEEHDPNYKAIVSDYNAKITSINLISGTANVKVGDIVKKGQVLIEPYVIDSSGNRKEVKADAEIMADVYFEGQSSHQDVMFETRRTGRIQKDTVVKLFGLNIYGRENECKYTSYDKIEEEIKLSYSLLLPFKLKKIIYYETESYVVETDFEEVKEDKIEEAKEKALQNLEDCDIIKEELSNITDVAGTHFVDYVIVVNKRIDTKESS